MIGWLGRFVCVAVGKETCPVIGHGGTGNTGEHGTVIAWTTRDYCNRNPLALEVRGSSMPLACNPLSVPEWFPN